MDLSSTHDDSSAPQRERWAFGYSVDGDLRFISHRDMMRLFQRALARATLPVKYTEGFNPHPRLSIPLPRPVGVASDDEALIVEFEQTVDGELALRKLDDQTPDDLKFLSGRRLEHREKLEPDLVSYRIELTEPVDSRMETRVRDIRESSSIEVVRTDPKTRSERHFDVRPFITDIFTGDMQVGFVLRVTGAGTARPAEIAGLLGLDTGSVNHRIRRVKIQWKKQF